VCALALLELCLVTMMMMMMMAFLDCSPTGKNEKSKTLLMCASLFASLSQMPRLTSLKHMTARSGPPTAQNKKKTCM